MKKIKYFWMRLFTFCYGKFHKIEKKILFESFHGLQYSDNPRAISEKLHELYPDFRIIWGLNGLTKEIREMIPCYVQVVNKRSLKFYAELATCYGYVTNEGMTENLYKRHGQFFVQTWHGDRGFKKILYENPDSAKPIDHRLTDLCVAGSNYGVQLYRKAFLYQGDILNIGCPRNDCLIENDPIRCDRIKERLSISGKKVLLYAPTFRDSGIAFGSYKVDLVNVLNRLEKRCNEEWVGLIRLHPTHTNEDVYEDDQRIINATDYPDMADLLQITDMLITDYSSCACDFAITKKPILIAAFDKDEYVAASRDLKTEIEAPGFIVCYSQTELEEKIGGLTDDDYIAASERVMKYFGTNETGKAAEGVCNRIFQNYSDLYI